MARVRAHPEEAAAVINGASLLVDLISRKVALPGYVIREMFNWAATFQRLVDNVVVPHETQEDASPRCDCGSRVLRSDVTVCADCGRWQ